MTADTGYYEVNFYLNASLKNVLASKLQIMKQVCPQIQ